MARRGGRLRFHFYCLPPSFLPSFLPSVRPWTPYAREDKLLGEVCLTANVDAVSRRGDGQIDLIVQYANPGRPNPHLFISDAAVPLLQNG